MRRRDFLRGAGRALFAALIAAVAPGPLAGAAHDASPGRGLASPTGRRFRGTPQGMILESLDGGLSWQPRANFGPPCAVVGVFEAPDGIVAQLRVQGHHFWLSSQDGRVWRTTDVTPSSV